jgi:signal peptidase II
VTTPRPATGVAAPEQDEPEIVEDDEVVVGGGGRENEGEDGGRGQGAQAVPWAGPSAARWILFGVIAAAVLVADQVTKAWIVRTLEVGEGLTVLGDWLRLVHWRNSGALFGLLPQSAPIFAVVSIGVVALIVVYHRRGGRGIVTSIALALLLGGALGNLVDRLRYGAVVDFVDMGIGAWRFYTYNMADAAISTAIVLLIAMALVPRIAEWGANG